MDIRSIQTHTIMTDQKRSYQRWFFICVRTFFWYLWIQNSTHGHLIKSGSTSSYFLSRTCLMIMIFEVLRGISAGINKMIIHIHMYLCYENRMKQKYFCLHLQLSYFAWMDKHCGSNIIWLGCVTWLWTWTRYLHRN